MRGVFGRWRAHGSGPRAWGVSTIAVVRATCARANRRRKLVLWPDCNSYAHGSRITANMRRGLSEISAILLAFVVGSTGSCANNGNPKEVQKTAPSPLAVSMVPSWSTSSGRGISMAGNTLNTFYVLLTNISTQSQAVFITSNSWGYYAVSFELRTSDGRVVAITKKPTGFTKNTPSVFVIPPNEQMVYPIKLDDEWEAASPLPIADEESADIGFKAIYEVKPTPESASQKVWTERIESPEYHLKFRHWLSGASSR